MLRKEQQPTPEDALPLEMLSDEERTSNNYEVDVSETRTEEDEM